MFLTHHLVAAAIAVGVVAPIAYVAFDRTPCVALRPVAETDEGTPVYFEVLTPEVRPGEELRWRIRLDRDASCEYHRTSYMVDGARAIVNFQPVELGSDGDPGTGIEYELSETIPLGASPGQGEYFRFGHYKKSQINEYWPLPPVLLGRLNFTILESEEAVRISEILRLLDRPPPGREP